MINLNGCGFLIGAGAGGVAGYERITATVQSPVKKDEKRNENQGVCDEPRLRAGKLSTTYNAPSDLPENLRRELPRRAQEIYLAAYDRTREKCAASEEYQDQKSIAETAHKAALLAVEMEYEQDEYGRWRKAPLGEAMDKSKIRKQA